jgi:hypothetical protein
VARNSGEDRDAIIAVLCAYIRGHSPWPPLAADNGDEEELRSLAIRANDVQVALTALGRLVGPDGDADVAIPRTDLRYARLSRLNLGQARLSHSNLRRARVRGTDLRGALLSDADLGLADIGEADLSGADLRGADLSGANLEGARLAGARADAGTRWPEGFDAAAAGVAFDPRLISQPMRSTSSRSHTGQVAPS